MGDGLDMGSFFTAKDREKGLIGSGSLVDSSCKKGLAEKKQSKLNIKIKAGPLYSEKDRKRGLV